MPLTPGTSLGPYQIDAPLGAGGMGEVYKATDTRLDRTVAIKVLPEHVANDPDLKQRFEREARTVAALNHPHICTLHDIGNQDGIDFLVMEYLDGQTLAQRLEKGALPLDQALTIAIEIADALDKAHRQGIVHRDLKPGNIMLTKAGAKLLDFGLAKLRKPGSVGAETVSAATTLSEPMTARGTLLGTLPYMAPEQVQGKDTDARTDLFAFGVIVYEMLTGRRVFKGDNQASLIAAILDAQPPALSTIDPVTPTALDHVVTRCLAKDADDRWQTARDLHEQLAWISRGGSEPRDEVGASGVTQAAYRRTWLWALTAFVVGIGVTAGVVWMARPATSGQSARFVVTTPPDGLVSGEGSALAISPDGTLIVYQVREGSGRPEGRQLWVRALDQLQATPLRGTEGAGAPFFSPDGEWLAFWDARDNTLKRMPALGGAPVTIAALDAQAVSLTWGPDDAVIFSNRGATRGAGLSRVPAVGGEPVVLTTPDPEQGVTDHWWPQALPDGETVLFTAWAGSEGASRIAAVSLATGDVTYLDLYGTRPQVTPTGHLVYGNDGTLWAVGFDPGRLEVTSAPVPVIENLMVQDRGTGNFAFAENGSLVYLSDEGGGGIARTLVWVDRQGREEDLGLPPQQYEFPRVSPDGTRVAVGVNGEANLDLWVWDVARGGLSRITTDPAMDSAATWTPDGDRVVFQSDREGSQGLFRRAADGTGEVERLMTADDVNLVQPTSLSPDGAHLLFHRLSAGNNWDIGMLSLDGERRPTMLVQSDATEYGGEISPDGAWVAYVSDEAGLEDVYVRRFPDLSERHRVSTVGGRNPVWSPDGKEIVFRRFGGDGAPVMMAVAVTTDPTFTVGTPEVLFEEPYYATGGRNYDLAPDGRLLMLKEHPATPDIHVVLDWFDELQRLVPTP